MALLEVTNLAAGYGRLPVLFDVSFTVDAGEIVAVSAGNGAGKSTLLACVSGLLRPVSAGSVRLRGDDITTRSAHEVARSGLVHVLERRRLAPFMTVLDNLRLSEAAVAPAERGAWRERFATSVRDQPLLRSHGNHRARELSGGQQQLVAVLRGLLVAPAVMLLDEPLQGLDTAIAQEVCDLLAGARDRGCAIVLTEHRAEVIDGLADRTLRLERGEIVRVDA